MTLPTYDSARDEILGLFNEYWGAQTPAVNGGQAVDVLWPGVSSDPPLADKPFARISVQHSTSNQSTFGETGGRRFRRAGLVIVQVFAPISAGGGVALAERLAMIARDTYEGKGTPSGIWFRNAQIREIGATETWLQFNVVVEFIYDEQK